MRTKERNPRDHYSEITEQIIAALEAGTPPWRQPWDNAKAGGPCMPQNAATGARYRGINVLTLGMSPLAFMTGDPRWATYKQAQERGWQVKKGAHGLTGFFYKRIEADRTENAGGESEGGKWFPLLRSFTLFHASQIDGIPSYLPVTVAEAPWRAPDAAETIVRNSRATIRIGGERAFYSPSTDHIQMPPQRAFRSPAAWASVQLHELGHWSGSRTRLNRDLSGPFGSADYAREELRAEIAQVMICAELGIPSAISRTAQPTWRTGSASYATTRRRSFVPPPMRSASQISFSPSIPTSERAARSAIPRRRNRPRGKPPAG